MDRAGACGSQVMDKCRDDPVCKVSCRCLTESPDCQDDGARARGAALGRAIVDVLCTSDSVANRSSRPGIPTGIYSERLTSRLRAFLIRKFRKRSRSTSLS